MLKQNKNHVTILVLPNRIPYYANIENISTNHSVFIIINNYHSPAYSAVPTTILLTRRPLPCRHSPHSASATTPSPTSSHLHCVRQQNRPPNVILKFLKHNYLHSPLQNGPFRTLKRPVS